MKFHYTVQLDDDPAAGCPLEPLWKAKWVTKRWGFVSQQQSDYFFFGVFYVSFDYFAMKRKIKTLFKFLTKKE